MPVGPIGCPGIVNSGDGLTRGSSQGQGNSHVEMGLAISCNAEFDSTLISIMLVNLFIQNGH